MECQTLHIYSSLCHTQRIRLSKVYIQNHEYSVLYNPGCLCLGDRSPQRQARPETFGGHTATAKHLNAEWEWAQPDAVDLKFPPRARPTGGVGRHLREGLQLAVLLAGARFAERQSALGTLCLKTEAAKRKRLTTERAAGHTRSTPRPRASIFICHPNEETRRGAQASSEGSCTQPGRGRVGNCCPRRKEGEETVWPW